MKAGKPKIQLASAKQILRLRLEWSKLQKSPRLSEAAKAKIAAAEKRKAEREENERWDRIFKEKIEDKNYYAT